MMALPGAVVAKTSGSVRRAAPGPPPRQSRGSSQRQGDARQDLAKRRQVKLSAFADAVAPGLALAQAIDGP